MTSTRELVFRAILPGWKGVRLPKEFPFRIRLALDASFLLVQLLSLLTHARPFGWLDGRQREALIGRMAYHRTVTFRALVNWWKLVALVTRA